MQKSGLVQINYTVVFMLFVVLLFFSVLYFTLSAPRCKIPFPVTCAGHIMVNNSILINFKNSMVNDILIDSLRISDCNKTTSGPLHADTIKTFFLEECHTTLIAKRNITIQYHLAESVITHNIEGSISGKRSR